MSATETALNNEWLTLTQAAKVSGINSGVLYQRVKTGRFGEQGVGWMREEGFKKPYLVSRSWLATQPDAAKRPYTKRTAKAAKPTVDTAPAIDPLNNHVSYAAGYLTAWLDNYARGNRIEPMALQLSVAKVLERGAK